MTFTSLCFNRYFSLRVKERGLSPRQGPRSQGGGTILTPHTRDAPKCWPGFFSHESGAPPRGKALFTPTRQGPPLPRGWRSSAHRAGSLRRVRALPPRAPPGRWGLLRPPATLGGPRGFNGPPARGKGATCGAGASGGARGRTPAPICPRSAAPRAAPGAARNWLPRVTPRGRTVYSSEGRDEVAQVRWAPGSCLFRAAGVAGHRPVTAGLPSEWHVHFVPSVTIHWVEKEGLAARPV